MFRNLPGLIAELRRRGKVNTSVLSDTRLTDFLNEAQDDVANEFDFSHLAQEETIQTREDVRLISGNFAYNRIELVSDVTANYPLSYQNEDWIREQDPNMSQVGAPYVYSVWGYGYTRLRIPTANTVVQVTSDNAADTGIDVTIRGIRASDGVEITEVLNTNGLSAVVGTTTFQEFFSVSKSGPSVGTITVAQNPVTTVILARIDPYVETEEKQFLYLWPTPTDERDIHVRGTRKPRRMTQTGHFPDLPSNYHELILLGALIRVHKDLLRFNLAKQVLIEEFAPRLEQLKKEDKNTRINRAPVKGGGTSSEPTIGRYPSNFSVRANGRW